MTYDEVDEIVFAEHSFVVAGDVQGYTRTELKHLTTPLNTAKQSNFTPVLTGSIKIQNEPP